MSAKEFKIKVRASGYPIVIPLDGQAVDATVARFTYEQALEFSRGFARVMDPHSARLVSMRVHGEEQEKRPAPTDSDPDRAEFVIPDSEIRRRRLVEMTDAQRAEYERLHAEEELFAAAFVSDQLTRHLTIASGQIAEVAVDGSERDVTSGADFVRVFGARRELLLFALRAIHEENTLPEPVKNALSSLRASQPSSGARELTATTAAEEGGQKPEVPAPSAAPAPSVTSATATVLSVGTPSGSTGPGTD